MLGPDGVDSGSERYVNSQRVNSDQYIIIFVQFFEMQRACVTSGFRTPMMTIKPASLGGRSEGNPIPHPLMRRSI